MSQEQTSNMFAIESSNKVEGASNYGIWRVKIKIILMKDLWDLVNPTLAYQDEGAKSSEDSNASVVDRKGNGQAATTVTMTSMHK
jgi:hypothetical protein